MASFNAGSLFRNPLSANSTFICNWSSREWVLMEMNRYFMKFIPRHKTRTIHNVTLQIASSIAVNDQPDPQSDEDDDDDDDRHGGSPSYGNDDGMANKKLLVQK